MKHTHALRPVLVVIAAAVLTTSPAHPAGSRYAALLASTAGQDTLRNLALWEDQRVTDNGRLFAYLKEGSPLVRRRALEVIGRMQEPADAERVIPSLKDKNPEVFREAVFALGQIGNAVAVTPLLESRAGRGPEAVAMIAGALGKIGGTEASEALTDMLRDFNATVRGAAAFALARTPGDTASGSLLVQVHDPDLSVRWRVIYALEKQPVLPRTCDTLVPNLESDDTRLRAQTARTLGKLECEGATRPLIVLLRDKEPGVVVNAARALGELKAKQAVDPLCTLLTSHSLADVRATAAEALGKIGEKGARDALMQGQLDTSVLVRTHCVRALAECLGEKSEMFIDQASKDGSRLVRAEAIACYGRAKLNKRAGMLNEVAQKDKDPMIRAAAVEALGQLKDDAVPPLLPPKLNDPDYTVAAAAVAAIGEQKYRAAVPALVTAYHAPRGREFVDVQLETVRVIGELGATEAESLLVEATLHEDYRVREAATASLTKLGRTPEPASSLRADRELSYDRSRRKLLAPPTGIRHAVIATSRGDIEVELYGDDAIQTVANFLSLARKGFYHDLTIHRVVPNFVVQGGDPRGDGSGDSGYTVPAEVSQLQYDAPGYLGIADAGKDTGSCQWFITMSAQPHLSGRYTIFGKVTKGMDAVWKIDRGDTFDVKVVD
jgi:HEAT repeat protein/cyclophilin family peptidyl-prolyl cis-trans isomerase